MNGPEISKPVASTVELSVVLPCYNEVDNMEPILAALEESIEPLGIRYELIFVDDFSNDGTHEKLLELAKQHVQMRVLRHRSNFGQSAAILSGYRVARGNVVVTMDADLQNDPRDIPELLRRLEACDCVCGVRQKRQDSKIKLISSRVANSVRGWILSDGIHDAGCTFRAIRKEALQQLPEFRALHRFLPTILRIHGFRVLEMPVRHNARTRGYSKYGVGNRLWVGIMDLAGMRWYKLRHCPPDRLELSNEESDHQQG